MAPIIKQAETSDKIYFFNLFCNSMKEHIKEIWGWDQNWQENNFESNWTKCSNYKLVHKENNIGFIQTIENESDLYIEMFILEPDQRSNGIGHEILNNFMQSYPQRSISLRVFKTNNRALSFYMNNGFQITNKEECFYVLNRTAL